MLHVAETGAQALAFLRREDPYTAVPRPALIVMDLDLPGLEGLQVLAALKADPALKRIPVVVLAAPGAPSDIGALYALGANSCLVKPQTLEQLLEKVRALEHYWCQVAVLPQD